MQATKSIASVQSALAMLFRFGAKPFETKLGMVVDINSQQNNNANYSRLHCIDMENMPKPDDSLPVVQSPPPRPRVDSKDLMRGSSALEIEHAGQCYLLRVTRENRLILTK